MTTAEILILIQTVILFLTGGVVAWYTWETHQLRGNANAQLHVMQRMLSFEIQREVRAGEPKLNWLDLSLVTHKEIRWKFVNEGEPVYRLVVIAGRETQGRINPGDSLPTGTHGEITLERSEITRKAVDFSIQFVTKTGRHGALAFRLAPGRKPPFQIESAAYD